jgi:nucleoside-diphosphate-sugar epimerase
MKILITGNKGFVGSATQRELEKCGHQVVGFDIMENKDIKDLGQLELCIQKEQPDRILHLAAIARFSEARRNRKLAFETNGIGTMNVSRVANKYHIPLVYSSTGSAIMPLDEYKPPYAEDIQSEGNSAYGCSKSWGETYVEEINPHIILRYAHIYGKEKRHHGLIGGFLKRIQFGMQPILYGGKQGNDFCYIDDIVQANVLALTTPFENWNEIYNVGTGEELTAEEAGKMVCEVFGYKGKIEKKTGRTVDPMRFVFDITKIKNRLGYVPKFKFREGLLEMKKQIENDKKQENSNSGRIWLDRPGTGTPTCTPK